MNSRDAVLALAALSVAPLSTRAQQAPRHARMGYLNFNSAAANARNRDAFRAGMRDLGYVESKNVHIEFRYADADNDRLPGLAAESDS